jgi:hypothetical protein
MNSDRTIAGLAAGCALSAEPAPVDANRNAARGMTERKDTVTMSSQ